MNIGCGLLCKRTEKGNAFRYFVHSLFPPTKLTFPLSVEPSSVRRISLRTSQICNVPFYAFVMFNKSAKQLFSWCGSNVGTQTSYSGLPDQLKEPDPQK
jgi:hypothetical protein